MTGRRPSTRHVTRRAALTLVAKTGAYVAIAGAIPAPARPFSVGATGTPLPQWASSFASALAGTEGYAYAVAQNGLLVASGASGFARSPHEAQHPSTAWTTGTRMNMASVSKTVTATAIMLLVQRGRIALTDPFLPYIQSLITQPVGAGINTVTITDLLEMKSAMVPDNPRTYSGTLIQYLNTYLQQPLVAGATPGVTYAYSDANFDILQVVINQVVPTLTPTAYTDYTDFVSRAVLAPMGVNTTLFSTTPDPQATATLSYSGASDARGGQYWAYTANVLGSGGWIAPVTELLTFAIGLRTTAVLSAGSVTTMFTQQLGWYAYSGVYGTYYQHNGGLTNGLNPGQGLSTGLIHFSNGYDAALFVNTPVPGIIADMIHAFEALAALPPPEPGGTVAGIPNPLPAHPQPRGPVVGIPNPLPLPRP